MAHPVKLQNSKAVCRKGESFLPTAPRGEKMDLKIYEIPHEMQLALNALTIDEETGEIIGWDKVEALTESATTKIANCARFIRYAEVQIDAMDKVIADIKTRKQSAQNLVDKLRVKVVQALLAMPDGKRKVEEPDIRVSTKKSESIALDDEKLLDKKFIKVEVITKQSPDKKAIKKAIKSGEEVAGARLCTNYTLQIK